ncbi:MAG: leucine-rich repeat domain-containing protein, partial [Kiritimatiellae bacterium]|nr:leucine-rich repeat domain-containing protein [Kiritimatiellia bacterium]
NKVNEIGSGAFAACPKLTTFNLESGNENYTVDGGLLLTIDRKSVVAAVAGLVDVTVPNGVTDVMDEAFSGHATLKSVVLPDSAKAIGEGAFSNATQFAVITIPSSVTAIGTNAFYGTKLATTYVATGDVSRVRGLITASGYNTAGVTFIEALSPVQEEPKPSIDGDSAATVTGNAEDGFVVTPSTTSGTVEVVIPSGIDAEKVTVEVPPTASVKPSGANVKVVKEANATSYDITAFLDIPAPNASGVIDLNAATVKPAIVKEALDPTKEGVDIDLKPTDPSITTAATRPGLTYTFSEGTSLEGMTQKATKVGDGTSWTPTITVKGGTSGFYSIGVAK